jgi:hypothetical protein
MYIGNKNHIACQLVKGNIPTILSSNTASFTQDRILATMIKTLRLGDVDVPVPGFGAMGISFALGNNLSYEEAEPVLLRAIELGCTFWDTAVYLNNCSWNAWSTDHDHRCLTVTV